MNSIKEKLVKKVLHDIQQYTLIKKNNKILIGISGGADSLALFLILHALKKQYNLTLKLVHINHQIRGKESDRDEKFVRQISNKFKTPLIIKRINIPLLKKKKKYLSMEEVAHQERIKFFNSLLQIYRYDRVALGHHQNDSIENYFLATLNGGSLSSLSGLKPMDGPIIRPLIHCWKKDLELFVLSHKIHPQSDSTNLNLHYSRNWIRHRLLPLIEKEYKPIKQTVLQLMDIVSNENEFVEDFLMLIKNECQFYHNFYHASFKLGFSLPRAIIRRLVKDILKKLKLEYNYYKINLITEYIMNNTSSLELNDFYVWRYKERILFTKKTDIYDYSYALTPKTKTIFIKPLNIKVKISETGPVQSFEKNSIYIKKEKINEIFIRNKKIGDYIIPMNSSYRVKVKKLLTDLKVSDPLKNMVPIVEINKQVAGIALNLYPLYLNNRVSEKYKVMPDTKKILKLEFIQSL